MRVKLLSVIFIALMVALAHGETMKFEVSGEAKIEDSDTVSARGLAIENAVKEALNEAMERFLSTKIVIENKDIIAQNIYIKKLGYINSLKVTGFKIKNSTLNTYAIEATIEVLLDLLEKDLNILGLMAYRENLPKVLTVIQEKNIDYVHWHFQTRASNNAETIIWKILSLKGYVSGPQDQLIQSITQESEQDFYSEDLKRIAELGERMNADIVVTGKGLSRPVVTLESAGDTVSSVAMVTLHAVRCLDGLELTTSSTSATTRGLNESEAGASAIARAAEEAILNILPEVLEEWSEGLEPVVEITMYVSGLKSIESLVQFKNEFINNINGIKSLERRTFSGGAAAYDVVSTSDAKTIVEELTAKGLKSFDISIRSHSQNSIDLKVNMR